jgi:hypothetical protein
MTAGIIKKEQINRVGARQYLLKLQTNEQKRQIILKNFRQPEDYSGRKLDRDEVVHHHINGINSDNRLSNLQLTTFSEDIRRHNLARGAPIWL